MLGTAIHNNIITSVYTLITTGVWHIPHPMAEEQFGTVEFSGWELIKYYYNFLENNFAGYSWQIMVSFNLVLYSLITMTIGFSLFWYMVYMRNRRKKKERKMEEYYADKFRYILGSAEKLTPQQIIIILDKSEHEIKSNDAYYYAKMLENARMSMYEVVVLPNMQPLAMTLGVCDRFESHLLHRKDVFRTLQMMLMLQITISEGRLANYVNHTNREIRMMARLNYITCSLNDPYRYLLEDLNEPQSLYRPMLLNYIFGWMLFQDRHMPNFLNLVDNIENDESSAYMLEEVLYWGKDTEKERVKNYLKDSRYKVRVAAMKVVAMLGDDSAEDILLEIYQDQPETIRQEILRTLLALNTGRQTEFFKNAYETSSARETQSVALLCLYQYGNSGRRLFEIMRSEANEETRRLIDQTDATIMLSAMQDL